MPPEEIQPEPKKKVIPVPDFVIYLITVAKGASKEYLQKIVVIAMIALSGWVIYGVTQITSMPKKYRELIAVDSVRDIRDMKHQIADSIKEAINTKLILTLSHKNDTLTGVIKQQQHFIYKM